MRLKRIPIFLSCLMLPISLAQAWSYGVINTTQRPGDSGSGCASCHGGSPGVVNVQLQGRDAILPGASERFTINIGNVGNPAARGGFTIAVTENAARQPTFSSVPGEPTQTADGDTQIVHNNNVFPLRLPDNSTISYHVDLDVPANAVLGDSYTLYGVGVAGHSSSLVGWRFAPEFPITIGPPTPEDVLADQDAATVDSIPLSWSGSDQGEHFRVVRKVGGFPVNPTDPESVLVYEGPATSTTATGLSAGAQYFFAVYGKVPDQAFFSTAAAEATAASRPQDPGALVVNPISGSEIELEWSGAGPEYRLLRRVDAFPTAPDDPAASVVFEGSATMVSETGLSVDSPYYYRVWSKAGGLGVFSTGSAQAVWIDEVYSDRFEQAP